MQNKDVYFDRNKWKESWRSQVVAQSKIAEFTGGAISYSTLANARSAGVAPEGFVLNGRRVFDIDELLDWIESRIRRN